jgi:hypothetical protein
MRIAKYLGLCLVIISAFWIGSWLYFKKQIERSIVLFKDNIEREVGAFTRFSYSVSGSPFSYKIVFKDVAFEGYPSFIDSLTKKWLEKRYGVECPEENLFSWKIAIESKDIVLKSFIWSPLSLNAFSKSASLCVTLPDSPEIFTSLEEIAFQVSKQGFEFLSYDTSTTGFSFLSGGEAALRTTKGCIVNNPVSGVSLELGSLDANISAPQTGFEAKLALGHYKSHFGSSIFDWGLDINDLKFATSSPFLINASLSNFSVSDGMTHSSDRIALARNVSIKDFEASCYTSEDGYIDTNFELFEVISSGSWLEDKLKEDQLDWIAFFDSCQKRALERLSLGQRNVPELKDLLYEIQSAKPEIQFNGKLIYQGKESYFSSNLTLQDLFPTGQLTFHITKDLFAYLAYYINAKEELHGLDAYEGIWELKNRVFSYNGSPFFIFNVPDWDTCPILTEDICVNVLRIPKEDYDQLFFGRARADQEDFCSNEDN